MIDELKAVVDKWEATIDPILKEDFATVDVCDRAVAVTVRLVLKDLKAILKANE